MEIRTATPNDATHVAPLIYSAGPELYDFIYKTDKQFKARTLQTVVNMFKFYGPIQVWPALRRSMHVEFVKQKRFTGKRAGIEGPDGRKLEMVL